VTSGTELTKREYDVIRASVLSHEGDREVSRVLGISIQRAKNHRQAAYRKLGVGGPHALIKAMRKLGWTNFL
jgi:DNA-binding CsgD family transcriptional regulator